MTPQSPCRQVHREQVFHGRRYNGTYTPGVIQRSVLETPSWDTAYTLYQPEISQGRPEWLLNFHTGVADLTGMATANASMLDEGTAAAEAVALLRPTIRRTAGDGGLPDAPFLGVLLQ